MAKILHYVVFHWAEKVEKTQGQKPQNKPIKNEENSFLIIPIKKSRNVKNYCISKKKLKFDSCFQENVVY